MRVVLTGGGTGGSVFPLLAVARELPEAEFLFIGTLDGPEKDMVSFPFRGIHAGKFRRYFSWENFWDHIRLWRGFFESLKILKDFRPDVIVGAGSFAQVPVMLAGWFLRIPSLAHQQDVQKSLSNVLVRPLVRKITYAKDIGNPVRTFSVSSFQLPLHNKKPVILVTGGGTGSVALNNLVGREICEFAQVIHITGKNKNTLGFEHPDYHAYEFLRDAMPEAMLRADFVVTRAGFSTLMELASLGKPAIIFPLPRTHQEKNADFFCDAAVVIQEDRITPQDFLKMLQKFLRDPSELRRMGEAMRKKFIPGAAKTIADEIRKMLK